MADKEEQKMSREEVLELLVQETDLTPKKIVEELDKYIIGQGEAKRAIAIAIRNRWRRLNLDPALQQEIGPKNMLMIGPTGVGKTEIARRLAQMVKAPFVKVEATKYTEVGYHGRDVDGIIRDLAEMSVRMVRDEYVERMKDKIEAQVEERLIDSLLPSRREKVGIGVEDEAARERHERTRAKLREQLREGVLEDRQIEIVAGRHHRLVGNGNRACGETIGDMGGENPVHLRVIQHACFDHQAGAARFLLFVRLENDFHRAGRRIFRQQARRQKNHRHMGVVPADMGDTGAARNIRTITEPRAF
jgi:nucleoside-triphosphatase THEP1